MIKIELHEEDSSWLLNPSIAIPIAKKVNEHIKNGEIVELDFCLVSHVSNHFVYALFGNIYCANDLELFGGEKSVLWTIDLSDSVLDLVDSIKEQVIADKQAVLAEIQRVLDVEANVGNDNFKGEDYEEYDLFYECDDDEWNEYDEEYLDDEYGECEDEDEDDDEAYWEGDEDGKLRGEEATIDRELGITGKYTDSEGNKGISLDELKDSI